MKKIVILILLCVSSFSFVRLYDEPIVATESVEVTEATEMTTVALTEAPTEATEIMETAEPTEEPTEPTESTQPVTVQPPVWNYPEESVKHTETQPVTEPSVYVTPSVESDEDGKITHVPMDEIIEDEWTPDAL